MDIMEPGYKMLGSSGTQYLNPDYIQPLPTTLDSKNSPLALLAQTCSSIGKDSGSSSKLSLPSLGGDKKDSSTSSSSSSSAHQRESGGGKDCKQRSSDSPMGGCSGPGSSSRTSGDGGRSNKAADKSSKDCSSRSSSGGGGGGGGSSSPKSRAHSSRPLSSLVSIGNGSGKCTPSSANTFSSSGSGSLHRDYSSTTRGASTTSSASNGGGGGVALPPSSALNNNNKTMGETGSSSSSGSLLYDAYTDDILKSSGLSSSTLLQHQQHSLQEALRLQHEGLQSLQAAAAAGLGPLPSGYPPLLFGHPLAAALDPLMYSYSASLAAVHGLALSSHKLPTLSPYMGYARVSTASGGSTLVPVCKDPYCTTGSLHSGHSLQAHGGPSHGGASTSCGPGCTQCGSSASAQDKSHQCTVAQPSTSLANGGGGLGSAGQFSSSLYPLSLPPGGLGNPLLGMAAAAHLGVGLTPYACSWLSGGGEFCGKRFSKAEDLLQHLRTHASSGETAALPAFSLPPGVPLPSSAAFAGAGHPFTIPGSLSPSSMLQQATGGQIYPRSLSPNSLLSASRYHPYKSPFAAVLPTSSTVSGALGGSAGSTLDAYYSSPYALYGHRIGAATVGP